MADREIIRAEIERRMKCFKNERNTITKASANNLSLGARIAMCEEILSFIDSMQEEPVSDDLEKEYKEFVEEDPVYNKLVNGIVGKAIAKHFYSLGLAQKRE